MELLATLVVIALVAGLSAPSITGWLRGQRLQEAIDDLRTDWIKARTLAMDEGRAYRFQINNDNMGYRYAPNENTYWSDQSQGVNAPPSSDPDEAPGLVTEKTLNPVVHFEAANDQVNLSGDNRESTFLFLPDGRARLLDVDGREHQEASVILADQDGVNRRKLTMRALTAQSSITPLQPPQ